VARWFKRGSAGAGRCLWGMVRWWGGPGSPRIDRLGYVVLEGESRDRLLSAGQATLDTCKCLPVSCRSWWTRTPC
jgi:hypothetical protein